MAFASKASLLRCRSGTFLTLLVHLTTVTSPQVFGLHARHLTSARHVATRLLIMSSNTSADTSTAAALTLNSTYPEVFEQLRKRTREEANDWLELHQQGMGDATAEWKTYSQARAAEVFHVEHVRRVMAEAGLTSVDPRGHDHSKDEWYWFVTVGRFSMGQKALTSEECKLVFKHHFKTEPHHEEYEDLTGMQCPDDAICEMAVDRLSRNLQKNGGNVNWEQMNKYEPVFTLGDTQRKLELYRASVKDVYDVSKAVWDTMQAEQQATAHM